GLLEDADERLTDRLALRLRIGHATKLLEELLLRVDDDEAHPEVAPERALDALALALAEQPCVHEDARELIADRPVDQRCRDRRVDTARQSTDHLGITDLATDLLDLGLDERARRPSRLAPTDAED